MNVVIYDDSLSFIDFLKNAFNELSAKHSGVFSEPNYFTEMNDVLAYVDANKEDPALYLQDIITGKTQTGYELGSYIKKVNEDNLIIYSTNYKEEILSNMKQKILSISFILKDSKRFVEELEEGLLSAHAFITGKYFIYKSNRAFFKIKYDDIYYFEKKKSTGYTYIIHRTGTITFKANLNELKDRLMDWFCYSTKEFIVNTRLIRKIDGSSNTVHFDNDIQCPYSRNHRGELLKWMLE